MSKSGKIFSVNKMLCR